MTNLSFHQHFILNDYGYGSWTVSGWTRCISSCTVLQTMHQELVLRQFDKFADNKTLQLATLVDPRMKLIGSDENNWREDAFSQVHWSSQNLIRAIIKAIDFIVRVVESVTKAVTIDFIAAKRWFIWRTQFQGSAFDASESWYFKWRRIAGILKAAHSPSFT